MKSPITSGFLAGPAALVGICVFVVLVCCGCCGLWGLLAGGAS